MNKEPLGVRIPLRPFGRLVSQAEHRNLPCCVKTRRGKRGNVVWLGPARRRQEHHGAGGCALGCLLSGCRTAGTLRPRPRGSASSAARPGPRIAAFPGIAHRFWASGLLCHVTRVITGLKPSPRNRERCRRAHTENTRDC